MQKYTPQKNLTYFCHVSSDFANFWAETYPQNISNKYMCTAQFMPCFICLYRTLYKLVTHQNAHCDVSRFQFILSLKRISQLLYKFIFTF